MTLIRRGVEPRAYKGKVRITAGRTLMGREQYSLAKGADSGGVTVPLTRAGRRLLERHPDLRVKIAVTTRGAHGKPVASRVGLHP